jgi:predicted Zn-dependent protease
MMSKQWKTLQSYLVGQNWGDSENLRYAMNARALREQDLANASKADWAKAFKESSAQLERLIVLERLTASWGWAAELEEILAHIVNRFPSRKEELASYQQLLYINGKSRALLSLYAQLSKSEPGNTDYKNNLAALALLLNAQEHKPHELASQVYAASPNNPSMASTYAFSLSVQKKFTEARAVLEKLKPEQLAEPNTAVYYGYVLASLGDKAQATKYLDLTAKARLLPEETQLVQRARQ